jgi:hypothetical protein
MQLEPASDAADVAADVDQQSMQAENQALLNNWSKHEEQLYCAYYRAEITR